MREVCFLIGSSDVVLWSDASQSPVAMPDSRERWQAIWSRRDDIVEIAHTHPSGPARFSQTDEDTMAALTSALGFAPAFSVITPEVTIVRTGESTRVRDAEPWWTDLLRLASGIDVSPNPGG